MVSYINSEIIDNKPSFHGKLSDPYKLLRHRASDNSKCFNNKKKKKKQNEDKYYKLNFNNRLNNEAFPKVLKNPYLLHRDNRF
jgi:hypothetical protein